MPSLELRLILQATALLAHNPAEGPFDLLFGLVLIGVIGLLFLGGSILLLRAIWQLLKKERPPN